MNTISPQFTTFGVAVLAIVFWITAQQASPEAQHTFNLFLGVLLLSMFLLHWPKISPLFFKGGTA
ncbi:hypothetical protein SD51_12180 [Alicyclobacillus tengchongensis]|nr:hypothetical protein SD51_12180 [Alicyclobacillus tengchongensis]